MTTPTYTVLTPRHKQVLRYIAHGLTSREIADQMGLSVQTIEVHRFNMMRRLHVHNVAQLLHVALVEGYLPKRYPRL